MSSLIGRVVGGYRILEELGRGGMGVVYKAEEIVLGRIVALKVLQGTLSHDKAHLLRFRQEALAAARLTHPNIVTIYAIAFEEDVPLIAMEYIEGVELSKLILETGALELEKALRIAYRVASALRASHEQGTIHRDIKPQNIMLDSTDRVRVLDFGIAKMSSASDSLTDSGNILGTPAYMAPEYFRGGEIDAQTDIYALGIVLYQMLTGRLPFEGSEPATVIQRILTEDPPAVDLLNPAVPKPVVSLVNRAIAKKKKDRFRTAEEFENTISKVLLGFNLRTQDLQVPTLILDPDDFPSRRSPIRVYAARLAEMAPATKSSRAMFAAGAGATLLLLAVLVTVGDTEQAVSNADVTPAKIETAAAPEDGGGNRSAGDVATAGGGPAAASIVTVGSGPGAGLPGATLAVATLEHLNAGGVALRPGGAPPADAAPQEIPAARAFDPAVREALTLYTGLGGAVDERRCRELIEEAAAQGDAIAGGWKAWFMHWGRCGYARDPQGAAELMRAHLPELRQLARVDPVEHPAPMPLDYAAAAIAAHEGRQPGGEGAGFAVAAASEPGNASPDALFLLGSAYDQGLGIKADERRGFQLVRQAAAAGHTPAITYAGWMHVEGRGTPPDSGAGFHLFLQSAELGDVSGMHNVGWMHVNGSGTEQNDERAYQWFGRGAAAGDARNMANLAWMYQQGRAVEKSETESFYWTRRAAQHGDHRSMFNLGLRLETGLGAEADPGEAAAWFERAAALGNEEAREKLGPTAVN